MEVNVMRFQINIDCTPEEARKFFGVPDILPMQQAMMEQLNSHLMDKMKMDPEGFTENWMPTLWKWTEMQQNFWKQMGGMANVNINPDGSPKKK